MLGTQHLAFFIVSGLLLNIAPGPDSLLIMTRGATQGWRAGATAALGIGAGCCVHIFAAALGLSALLATSATAFTVVKLAGAAYLLYVGLGLLRAKAGAARETVAMPMLPLRRIFAQGFLTNVLNPKVAVFFLAFVPQFIAPGAVNKPLAFLFLGFLFNFNGMLWCLFLACSSAYAGDRVRLSARVSRWLDRVIGGMFVSFGVKLALAKQN
jgi:threonine/homoserine/homoserine lactone efflux protein